MSMSRMLSAALLLAIGGQSAADTTMVFEGESGTNEESGRMEIGDGKIRFDTGGQEQQVRMVFDADANLMTVIDDERRSYMVIDEAMIEQLAATQRRVMAQMEAQMADLPPAAREQMKSMMKNMGGGAATPPEPRRYERTGQIDTVAGLDCEVLQIYSGDKLVSTQCVVGLDELEMPAEDFATLRAMQAFVVELAGNFAAMQDQVFEFGEPERQEFPIRYEHRSEYGNSVGQMKTVDHDAIPPERFAVPAGYKQEKIPDLGNF